MAVKTITIDMEAYDLLARNKRAGQSFSQVIKAHFGPLPTAGRFLSRVRSIRVATDALDQMERQVRRRRAGARPYPPWICSLPRPPSWTGRRSSPGT